MYPVASGQESFNSLPTAGEMFQTVKKAEFLGSSKTPEIDWDKLVTNKANDTETKCEDTHAVPPPNAYEPQTQALKPTLGDITVRKRHADDDEETNVESKLYLTI